MKRAALVVLAVACSSATTDPGSTAQAASTPGDVTGAGASAGIAPGPPPPKYTMIDLTEQLGGGSPGVTGLTSAGDFCGYATDDYQHTQPPYCFNVWTHKIISHPELIGYTTTAVNAAGVILARKIGIPPGPDVLDVNGTLVSLPPLGSTTEYTGLNDAGDCVGYGLPPERAWLYRRGDVIRIPGSLGAVISRRGEVAAIEVDQFGNGRPFIWSRGRMSYLPDLGGFFTTPSGINDGGAVAGSGYLPRGDPDIEHAFYWDGLAMHDLGADAKLAGSESWALALNDYGEVVGSGRVGAFLFSGGVVYDLNELASAGTLHLAIAFSINDEGVVLAYAWDPSEFQQDNWPRHIVVLLPER